MAETPTRSPAAPADPAEETFELAPEDLVTGKTPGDEADLEVDPDADPEAVKPKPDATDPAADPKVEPAPDPEPEAAPKPVVAKAKEAEPEREEPRERLHPAVREERSKRKEYARLYGETKEKLDEAERTINLLRSEADQTTDPALKKWNEELLEKASKATDLADVVKLTILEMDRRDRARVRALNQHLYTMQCDISEARARARHQDFETIVAKAGLFEAIATDAQGRFKDERLGRRIYYNADNSLNADPAERMYRLAVGKLEYEREQRGEAEPEEAGVQNGNGTGDGTKKEPRAEVVEAERRGAARVVEQVSKNVTRLKGIRSIPKATTGPVHITKRQLDEMLEREPEKYQRLVSRRPDVERFHLS